MPKKKKRGPGRPASKVAMVSRTFYLPKKLAEKVAGYAYWERMTVSAALTTALQEFFEDKDVRPVPEGGRIEVGDVYKDE